MADDSTSSTTDHTKKPADVFSRGSLKLTYDVLRGVNPSLALLVRNISLGEPFPKENEEQDNPHTDYFLVTLDSFQVREVVENLVAYTQSDQAQKGLSIMATALIDEWLELANKMIQELPTDQRPR
jgi:hypothetical protein